MTHYLRDAMNNTVVDVEALPDDIQAIVCIDTYSRFLLGFLRQNPDRTDEVIAAFNQIQEIRGEFFESGWKGTPDELAETRLRALGEKYGLAYVTD